MTSTNHYAAARIEVLTEDPRPVVEDPENRTLECAGLYVRNRNCGLG